MRSFTNQLIWLHLLEESIILFLHIVEGIRAARDLGSASKNWINHQIFWKEHEMPFLLCSFSKDQRGDDAQTPHIWEMRDHCLIQNPHQLCLATTISFDCDLSHILLLKIPTRKPGIELQTLNSPLGQLTGTTSLSKENPTIKGVIVFVLLQQRSGKSDR